MNYIILDLEWNQSSTGEEEVSKILPFEIIEIGAIKLNSSRQKIDEFNELIKPQIYHEMHNFTGKLIHIRMEDLENKKTFPEVMNRFRGWWGEDYIFCTWGPLDLIELQRNIRYYELEPIADAPFKFLDVQKLFSIACGENKKSRKSLEYAIDFLKIEKDIPFHRALSDAHYTAKVLEILDEKILEYCSFDVFHIPAAKKDEVKAIFNTEYQEPYIKYISRGFDNKIKAMNDRNIVSTRCFLCNKSLRKKIKWFSTNSKHYYSVSYCDKHGYMKAKIRIRKTEDGRVYVVKTEKYISEEDVKRIQEKQEHAKQHRREKRIAKNQNHRRRT